MELIWILISHLILFCLGVILNSVEDLLFAIYSEILAGFHSMSSAWMKPRLAVHKVNYLSGFLLKMFLNKNIWPHLAVLRFYSWYCTKWSLVTVLQGPYRVLGIKLGGPCAKQVSYLLYYLFSPPKLSFFWGAYPIVLMAYSWLYNQ